MSLNSVIKYISDQLTPPRPFPQLRFILEDISGNRRKTVRKFRWRILSEALATRCKRISSIGCGNSRKSVGNTIQELLAFFTTSQACHFDLGRRFIPKNQTGPVYLARALAPFSRSCSPAWSVFFYTRAPSAPKHNGSPAACSLNMRHHAVQQE
jgi:hypothetical protein